MKTSIVGNGYIYLLIIEGLGKARPSVMAEYLFLHGSHLRLQDKRVKATGPAVCPTEDEDTIIILNR